MNAAQFKIKVTIPNGLVYRIGVTDKHLSGQIGDLSCAVRDPGIFFTTLDKMIKEPFGEYMGYSWEHEPI